MDDRYDRAAKEKDDLVYEVCRLFCMKLGPSQIRDALKADKRFKQRPITREAVYPLILAGHARGFFELYPPWETQWQEKIELAFRPAPPKVGTLPAIQVVNVMGDRAKLEVPLRAAKTALELIRAIAADKREGEKVHVGFASGWSSREVARGLANAIRSDPTGVPPLELHALSSGFRADHPATACITFFSFFHDLPIEVSFVGLFTAPFVEAGVEAYESAKLLPGAREAFARRDHIDLIVTSLARAADKDSELRKFKDVIESDEEPVARSGSRKGRGADPLSAKFRRDARKFGQALAAGGHVGDVLHRPFGDGPIEITEGYVPFTLFGIRKLVERIEKQPKSLLLVSGPCHDCGEPRTEALLPLLESPQLKVWSHVVMDAGTATAAYNARSAERGKGTAKK